jgi:8-oxo-dGTP pyrophosphatase MutT (NUDIX family)
VTSLRRLREHPEVVRLAERIASHRPVEVNEPGARRAAVSLILRLGAQTAEPEIFFIQRAHYETDPWSGQIAFPGGREEPGDASLVETAVRETWEETAIDIRRRGEVLGPLDDLPPMTVRLPAVVVRPYVALIGEHPEPVLSHEVAASFWVPLASLRNDSAWRDTVVTAGGLEFTRRAFHHGEFVIWGMTERILSHFLALAT